MNLYDFIHDPLIAGVLIGLTVPLVVWLSRALQRQRQERQKHRDQVRRMVEAFVGKPADPITGAPEVVGLQSQLHEIHERLGSNGGSTVFDGIDTLKEGQRALAREAHKILEWTVQNTATANAVMEQSARAGAELSVALEQAGITWTPEPQLHFQAPLPFGQHRRETDRLPEHPDEGD